MVYTIDLINYPFKGVLYRSAEDIKINFFNNNDSLKICVAMILGKKEEEVEACGNFHRIFYGKYLGGFSFEGYNALPPLCILQTVCEGIAVNVVYYNGIIYDPQHGMFDLQDYSKQNISVLSYVQMFIPEAYEGTEWKPYIPIEIKEEFEKDTELCEFFVKLPVMEQSKILNYIYPFSKPSSFKEKRKQFKPLTPTRIQQILSHIKALASFPKTEKPAWEELEEFEMVEAVEILKSCGVREGSIVLDFGCGHGHYTFAASIAVGESGKVIAVDAEIEGKVLKYVEKRAADFNLKNIICLKTNEEGLSEYENNIDFIILYDVLHGMFHYSKSNWETTMKLKLIDTFASLLKKNGILSLALYSEIEHKRITVTTKEGKDSYILEPIPHDEAIKPYIDLIKASGFALYNVIENAGVHFDDFHNSYQWRKYGEVKVSSLEKRNIYNFVKN